MKTFFAKIFAFTTLFVSAQTNIEIPTFETVNEFDGFRNFITIAVDKQANVYLNDEEVTLKELESTLLQTLYTKIKNDKLSYLVRIEFIADKNVRYSKVAPVISKLRELGFVLFVFASNSKKKQRIPNWRITGFGYKYNYNKRKQSIIKKVSDSINRRTKEEEEEILANLPPPPPPPPPPSSIEYFKKAKDLITKTITVDADVFMIDDEKFTATQLLEMFMKWSEKENMAYIVKPTENCSYQNVITPIALLQTALNKLRNEESLKLYKTPFEELDFYKYNSIKEKFPFRITFD